MASGGQSFAAILDRLERGRGMKCKKCGDSGWRVVYTATGYYVETRCCECVAGRSLSAKRGAAIKAGQDPNTARAALASAGVKP